MKHSKYEIEILIKLSSLLSMQDRPNLIEMLYIDYDKAVFKSICKIVKKLEKKNSKLKTEYQKDFFTLYKKAVKKYYNSVH